MNCSGCGKDILTTLLDFNSFHEIEGKLIESFILKEYINKYGVTNSNYKGEALNKYKTDSLFRAKVNSTAATIINIVSGVLSNNKQEVI